MSYQPRTVTQDIRHDGTVLLNRRISLNPQTGKIPEGYEPEGVTVWNGIHPCWTVVRKVPRRKTWAKSTHGSARVVHRVKYQLIATHMKGMVVQVTVWACDKRCHSAIVPADRPEKNSERCWPCDRPITIPRPTSHD